MSTSRGGLWELLSILSVAGGGARTYLVASEIEKFFLENMYALLESTAAGLTTTEGELFVAP